MKVYIRLLKYTLRHKGRLAASMAAAIAVGVFNTATVAMGLPFFRVLFGEEAGGSSTLDKASRAWIGMLKTVVGDSKQALLLGFLALLVLFTALKSLFRFLQDAWTSALTRRTVLDVAEEAFGKALRQPIGFYEGQGTAGVVLRFTTDIDFLSAGLGVVLMKLVREPLKAIGMIAVAAAIDLRLTLLTLALFPVILLAIGALARRIRRRARGVLEARGGMMDVASQALTSLRTVQAFGNEGAEEARFRVESARLYDEDRRMNRTDAFTSPALETLTALGLALALWAGIGRIVALDAASFVTLYLALGATLDPFRKMGDVGNRIQVSGAAADRLFALLDRAPEIADAPGARDLLEKGGAVSFEGVGFVYPDGRVALDGVSFAVEARMTVAVVGPSGAGKSTLLDLLPRLRDPSSGRVIHDGVDLREATVASVRTRTAIVHQHPDLFDGTIAANIARGRTGAAREEVVAAAKRAHAHEFIERLPLQYETPLSSGGIGLSGGQRQRLALARAILKDPVILLLDEPTSALDRESEDALRAAWKDFLPGRTVFVIAHRPGTVEHADRVLVLRDGRVEAFGTPEAVAASSPTYRRLMAEGFAEPVVKA